MTKIKIGNPFLFCFSNIFLDASREIGPVFVLSQPLLHSSVSPSLSWCGLVGWLPPSWWQPTIGAQAERREAIIHSLEVQVSLKGILSLMSVGAGQRIFSFPLTVQGTFSPHVFFSCEELVFWFQPAMERK